MDNHNHTIEIMMHEFHQTSKSVEENLCRILDKVKTGHIPTKDEIENANTSLNELKENYYSVYIYTKDIIGDTEEIKEGDSVFHYEKQAMESQLLAARKKIEKASDILYRFTQIIALEDKYRTAIENFQKEADKMLYEINRGNPIETCKNLPDTTSHKLFLDAMVETDEDKLDGMAELVAEEFNYTANLGILRKKYVFEKPRNTSFETGTEKAKDTPTNSTLKNEDSVKEEVIRENPTSEPVKTEDIKVYEEEVAGTTPNIKIEEKTQPIEQNINEKINPNKNQEDISAINPKNTKKEIIVSARSMLDDKQIIPDTKLYAKEKLKTSTPSASAFKKEIIKLSHTYIGMNCILPILTNLGLLTAEQIYTCGVCLKTFTEEEKQKNLVIEAVKALAHKGFLVAYDFNETTVYCLSNYSYSSMHKDTIIKSMKDFWSLNYGNFKMIGQEIIEISEVKSIMDINNALIKYMYSCLNQFEEDIVATINTSINWDGTYYHLKTWINNEFHECILANNKTELSSITCNKILYIEDDKEIPDNLPNFITKVFKFNDNSIFVTYSKNENTGDKNIQTCTSEETEIVEEATINEDSTSNIEEAISTEAVPENTETEETTTTNETEETTEEPKASTPEELLNLKTRIPTEEEFFNALNSLLSSKKVGKEPVTSIIVQSVLLARAASFIPDYNQMKVLDKQLQLATNISLSDVGYHGNTLSDVFSSLPIEDPCLSYAAYAFAMLIPDEPYDHMLNNSIKQCFGMYDQKYEVLPATFKQLFNNLTKVTQYVPQGFNPAIIASIGNEKEKEKFLSSISKQARENLEYAIPKKKMKTLPQMYNREFGEKSAIRDSLKIVASNNIEEMDIVKTCLSIYCLENNNTFRLDHAKLDEELTKAWDAVNPDNKHPLSYDAHSQALNQYTTKLKILIDWYNHISNISTSKNSLSKMKTLRKDILNNIETLQKDGSWKKLNNSIVLTWMLIRMESILNGTIDDSQLFAELLHTGIISLNENWKPLLNEKLQQIPYYEPWRNILKHIVAKKKNFSDIQTEITTMPINEKAETLFDNLQQLRMIGKLIDDTQGYEVTADMITDAEHYADCAEVSLLQDLEMAYTYGRINEQEKEDIVRSLKSFKSYFYENNDYACWRDFLNAARRNVEECQAKNQVKISVNLDKRLKQAPTSKLLLRAQKLFQEEQNFAVAEDYINRFDSGDTSLLNIADSPIEANQYFKDFINDDSFMELYNVCQRHKGSQLLKYGVDYIDKHHPAGWTSRDIEDSKRCISKWPSSKNTTSPQTLEAYFDSLGFDVTNVSKDNEGNQNLYLLNAKPTPRSKSDYTHPIAKFGTRMQSPISVIVLYGNREPKELLDEITTLDRRGISIVLLDYFVTVSYRRQLCAYFHQQTSRQNPFLLIDQVLALHLAMLQKTERIPAMLKCTLPFATCQPFLTDKADSVADEMFYGRNNELSSIMNSNGASIVYGGRQLGKTALLQRAESLVNKPSEKRYAIYTNIMFCDNEKSLVKKLINEISLSTNDAIKIPTSETLEDFCNNISKLFASGKINYLLLLMDEADNFLKAIADNSYSNLQSLVELKRRNSNFKFVLAGLHNVCRAKNATKDNGVFGQLGEPLCVKPLPPIDALALLNKPLDYLGFSIDKDSHLETILTNTNYYPGLIQFFGYKLVETLSNQYSKYYSAQNGNPPFNLNETQLGYVMNSADLNKSIKNKFKLTLELDPRYFMLARCITLLYDLYGESISAKNCFGYTISEIKDMADSYEIKCLANETDDSYTILLDEMAEMGVLSKPAKGIYKLRRISFVDIIGNDADALEAEILENNN